MPVLVHSIDIDNDHIIFHVQFDTGLKALKADIIMNAQTGACWYGRDSFERLFNEGFIDSVYYKAYVSFLFPTYYEAVRVLRHFKKEKERRDNYDKYQKH